VPSFYLPPSITSWGKQLPSSPLITCCFVLPSGCPRERFNFAASTLQNMFLVWREWDQAKRKIRKHIWPIWKQVLFIGVDTRPFGRLFHLLKTIATNYLYSFQILYRGGKPMFQSGLHRADYVHRLREQLWMQDGKAGSQWQSEHYARWLKKEATPDSNTVMQYVDGSTHLPLYTYVWDWFGPDQEGSMVRFHPACFVNVLCR